ncbi:hypothetical protein FGL97_23865 [Pseudomonas putida]|nr:hypothetical protein [Pseudomonas putida]NVN70997.1 hypothetical protein [Pseudomonas putida]
MPANAVAAATVYDRVYWLAGPAYSRVNPLLPRYWATPPIDVGAGLPAKRPAQAINAMSLHPLATPTFAC